MNHSHLSSPHASADTSATSAPEKETPVINYSGRLYDESSVAAGAKSSRPEAKDTQ